MESYGEMIWLRDAMQWNILFYSKWTETSFSYSAAVSIIGAT